MIPSGIVHPEEIQTQRVGDDAEAGQAHGCCGEHGIELPAKQWDPYARRQGNADGVVDKGPKQVFVDVAQRRAAQADGRRHIGQTAFHQHHIRRVNGNIRARTDGNADIGAGQGRCVVDAVAHHNDLPFLLQLADHAFLSVGKDACNHLIHAGLCADGSGGAFIIAGEHHHMDAHIPHFGNGLGAVLLNGVRHSNDAAELAVPGKKQRGFALLGELFRSGFHGFGNRNLSADKLEAAAQQRCSVQGGSQSIAGQCLKLLNLCRRQTILLRSLMDRTGQRMFAFLLQCVGNGQQIPFGHTLSREDIRDPRLPLGDGSRFIQRHNLCLSGFFQRHSRFEQNAVLCAHATPHHDGNRGGKPQRTGAADDQNGDTPCQSKACRLTGKKPDKHGDNRDGDNGRNKDTGNLICHLGNGGFCGCCIADHLNDLGKGGVLADSGGLAAQKTRLIQRACGNLASFRLIHGNALPRQSGFIHRTVSLADNSVYGDVFAGTHHKNIALCHLFNGDSDLRAVPQKGGGLGRQLHQPLQSIRGFALGTGFQHFAQGNQGQNRGGGFKIEFVHIDHDRIHLALYLGVRHGEQGEGAVAKGCRSAQRNQSVHVGRTMPQALKPADKKLLIDDHDDHRQQ